MRKAKRVPRLQSNKISNVLAILKGWGDLASVKVGTWSATAKWPTVLVKRNANAEKREGQRA